MAININPNRINTTPGTARRPGDRPRQQEQEEFVVPNRAMLGVIPEPESLATLVRSAVASLRKGIFWDRGTILNIIA